MQIFYTDHFVLPIPNGHRFPMQKYRLLREHVQQADWLQGHTLVEPPAAEVTQLLRAHHHTYVTQIMQGALSAAEVRRIGFPWSPQMVERSRRAAGATLAAAHQSLCDGVAISLAGGTHHACVGHGEGYCVFNDSAVAALELHALGLVKRVLVVDLDVHQGNGTADIMRPHEWCYTFSMHGAKNYPFRKVASDCDIDLPDGTTDDEYLTTLATALDYVFHMARPDLVLYVSGADPYEDDSLGRLKLTKPGLATRDAMVAQMIRSFGVPCVVTMAGGYANDINDSVAIHANTVRTFVKMNVTP
ncbi:MAG: histone deacetylase [Chloroflexia bacterium]|nr:histone deacetylase [Chloroflexia bacterium]